MLREIQEIQGLATKYSKAELGRMVQMGLLDPQKAMMAGMMIQRIEQQNAEPPQTTVAQDVLGLPAVANQAPQAQPQPQAPTQMAQAPQGAPQGIESLPAGDVGNYAGGGMVALAGGITDADARAMGYNSAADYYAFQDIRGVPTQGEAEAVPAPEMGASPLFQPYPGTRPGSVKDRFLEGIKPVAPAGLGSLAVDNTLPAGLGRSPAKVAAPTAPVKAPQPTVAKDKYGIALPSAEANLQTALGQAETLMPESQMPKEKSQDTAVEEHNKLLDDMGVNKDMYRQQREKLEAERGDLVKDREEAKGMRILEAGLAIMAGESPHAFVNIGKGAGPAMQGLAQDIKDLKKADRELTRAQMQLETAENQFKMEGTKDVQNRMDKAAERVDKARQNKMQLVGTMANSINSLTGSVYGAQTQADASRANAATAAAASRYAADKDQRELNAVMAANPGMTILEAMQEVGQAKHPKDVYNALSQRVASAVKLQELDSTLTLSRYQLAEQIRKGKKPGDKEYDDIARNIKTREQEINRSVGVDERAIDLLRSMENSRVPGARRTGDGTPPPPAPAPAAPTAVPQAAVADLKANDTPARRAQFDAIFGAGAAARALGR